MSLKSFLTILLSMILLFSLADAKKKKKDRAGYIKNGVFTDTIYNYQFTMPEYWKAKIQKKTETIRVNLTTKGINDRVERDSTDIYKEGYVPLASFWVIENSNSCFDIMDSIVKPGSKHALTKQILELIKPEWKIDFDGIHTSRQRKIEIGGKEGVSWIGAFRYSFRSVRQRLDNSQGGSLILIDIDDKHKMLIVVRSDAQRQVDVLRELKPAFESLKFDVDK